jgi:hypothetical protein
MTTTGREQDTLIGIRAVYDERRYDVDALGQYFQSLARAWYACLELSSYRKSSSAGTTLEPFTGRDPEGELQENMQQIHRLVQLLYGTENSLRDSKLRRRLSQTRRAVEQSPLEFRIPASLAEGTRRYLPSLTVSRLRVESPMDLTLAVIQGGGTTAVVAYSVHLLVHVMRDPQRVGGWLPRLVAGWHKGMTDAEQARQDHVEAERERKEHQAIAAASKQLVTAAEALRELPATQVTALAAGEPSDEIVAAFKD